MKPESGAYEALIQFLYQSPIGLLQARLDGEVLMANPMSAQLLVPLAPGGNLLNLFEALQGVAPQLRAQTQALGEASGVICESLRVAVAHPRSPVKSLDIRLLKLDADTLIASVSDATAAALDEEQRVASQLRDATRTDSLTLIPNRAVALERIEQALLQASADPAYQFALLFINIDRFNRVNASLGPGVGDELLRLVATRLTHTVRLGDVVVSGIAAQSRTQTAARLGSDEFVVVLEGLRRADDAHGVAQRLLDVLAKPYGIAREQLHLSASMGVVLRDQAEGDADAVLQDASTAMRVAKREGGGRYCVFEPPMKQRAARRGQVESDLRRALAQGELFVVYQPLVDLVGGACSGVEALVRWQHPTRGLVSPVEFIEVAEETGLIAPLGAFVLATACRQFAAWQRELGTAAPQILSVNLSRAQLADAELPEQVAQVLDDSGLAARHLQLEITESLAAQGEVVQLMLHQLKALGIGLALDDFGTGYSSLASLHLLPVDVVKIDRSFVSQAETSAHHRVLIEATVRVARSLGMRTVAEGIETVGQADILAELACDKGQGYLYARPLPATDARAWIAARLS
jgi:diguanylate cyclase (GGDEF)-like protein